MTFVKLADTRGFASLVKKYGLVPAEKSPKQ